MKNLDGNNLVTQANNIIEARYSLTKNEQIILCAMISFIEPNDKDFLTYKTSISDFALLLNVEKKYIFREIDGIVKRLLTRVIQIETSTGWKMFQWVSYAEANIEKNSLLLKFHDELKPYLLDLRKRFTSFRLQEVINLKSVYSIRIYQLLTEYHNKGKLVFLYPLSDLRNMLLGDKSKKYTRFKDFRVNVLEKSQSELNKKSKFSFTFEAIKEKRKITKIEFSIVRIQRDLLENKIIENDYSDSAQSIFDNFELIGIKRNVIIPFLERDGKEALERTLQIFNKDKKSGKIRDNEQGYLIGLLKAQAGVLTDTERKEQEEKERKKQERLEKERQEQLEAKKLSLSKSFLKDRKEAYLANLSEQDADNILKNIRATYAGNSVILNMVKDIKSPIVQEEINKLVKNQDGYSEGETAYIEENLKL